MKKTDYYKAYLDDMHTVNIFMALNNYGGESKKFYIERDDHHQIPLTIVDDIIIDGYHKYECYFDEKIQFGREYLVYHEFARYTPLIFAQVVKSEAFDEMFYYAGTDLGCTYQKEKTTFKLWAPTAYNVYLALEKNGQHRMLAMKREAKGVYAISIEEDLLNASYLYHVEVNGEINRCLDPYAKANTPNSKRSVVVDMSSIHVSKAKLPSMQSYCDAIIYELSIRDYSVNGNIESFLQTGRNSILNYVRALGITHLQLLPMMDFKSVDDLDVSRYYNWGYDPYQWMAFENSYSSNVYDPMQIIKDFALLVETCHRHQLRVNLDVVFNHVCELNDCSLQMSVPYYYFQFNEHTGYSNATMCGNDVDSKRKMCRKLIVNACEYLAGKFKIDGFRFDLMGILDIETMNEIVAVCKRINPDFMIYGEGWDMPSYLAKQERASLYNNRQMPHIAHFSDRFRDVIKGSTDLANLHDLGYMLSNTAKLYECMNVMGASTQEIGMNQLFMNANQSVNYVECHDNMTSWDKIDAALNKSTKIKKLHHKMLIASVLLAQGIPFLHGGQEFCRTKNGLANTYNAPDSINKINWSLAKQNKDVIVYTKELIALRKEFSCLRQYKAEDIHKNVSYGAYHDHVLRYNVKDENDELIIFFNPTYTMYPYAVERGFEMIFYNNRLKKAEQPEFVDIHGLSVVIFKKIKPVLLTTK
ncbi:MAG: type I pullulanase [Erysipelotrichia bacterium]|nr:type I pullulanase [Erysipelotrichia bacterium]NCC54395.1 type I pullulanase [Erysipelotrichia bacterium]